MSESNTEEYCAYCEADTPARYVCVLCDNNICSEHWLVSDRKDGKEVCRECAGDPECNPDGSDVKCFWCNSRWVDTFDPDHRAWIHKECDPHHQHDDCCPHCGEAGYWETAMSVKECCKYCESCKTYKSSELEGWTYSEDGDLCPDCNA